MNIDLSHEQLDLLISMVRPELAKKEQGFIKRWLGWGDKDEPTLAGLLKYAERYIRTQRGCQGGSWSTETEFLDLTISVRVKPVKTTT